ncbi:hypothetical protein NQ317_008895 [Molorchus minor]|uniref:Flagellar FliJ protein n=1 Tax=Molorchus minor TaxID=1323400 RepID=A0ABQ9IY47_9CUCU|nr:hypothetical protein NQ317_008895 [Molorchus minor]
MDELSFNFEQFRVSAVDKVKKIDKKLNCRHEHKNYNNDQQPQQNLPVRQILKEFEVQRQAKVKNSVQARISDLQTFSNKQIANKKQAWLKMQQAFITDMHQKESSIFQALNECEKNNVRMRSKLVQHYQELADLRKNHEIELEAREKTDAAFKLHCR